MECPKISAHIRELTVSVQVFCLNQGETVSDQDSVVCSVVFWSFDDEGSDFSKLKSSESI